MPTKFRKDWIVQNYTQEEWNEMYETAGTDSTEDVIDFNEIYDDPEAEENVEFNEMYEKVNNGEYKQDQDMKDEVDAWNAKK